MELNINHLIKVRRGKDEDLVTLIHVHNDETTALKVAEETDYRLVSIDSRYREFFFSHEGINYRMDPNRMFSLQGIKDNLSPSNPRIYPVVVDFAREFLGNTMGSKYVVALHNAWELGIDDFVEGKMHHTSQTAVQHNKHSRNNFILTNKQEIFETLYRDFNTVLLKSGSYDGSYSDHASRMGQGYVNIEAGLNQYNQQKEMLEAVLTTLK